MYSPGGHLECLTQLIAAGASVDLVDVKCQTPLFVATRNKHLQCCQALLQHGADPDGDAGNMTTPLYLAFENKDVDTVLVGEIEAS